MRGLNLDHLHTFSEVIALGSFSAAAVRMNLSQPAVSLQIRQLERRFGVRLIERVGKRATATAAGQDLLDHLRGIEAAVEGALEAMAYHATGTVGRVRLGTGATACIHVLPGVLPVLRERFPSLEIVVQTGNSQDILKALEDNRIDVALVTLPVSGRMFQVVPVIDDEIVAAAATLPDRVTADVLATLPVVIYERGAATRRLVDDWFARAGQVLKPVMELGSVEATKKLVEAGLGCGILPRLAASDSRDSTIVVRPLSPPLFRTLAVVLRRDKSLSRGLREVVRALTDLQSETLPSLTTPSGAQLPRTEAYPDRPGSPPPEDDGNP